MAATFAELILNAVFLMFMNAATVFTLTSEQQALRATTAIMSLVHRAIARSFLPQEAQATSQPERRSFSVRQASGEHRIVSNSR